MSKAMVRRIVFSSSVGNALEWFDFLVYGYFATVIAKAFFPSHDEWLSTMLAIGTFGISFLMRPLGAIVLGILLMMVGTLTMAVMPSYQHIGVAAPLLILLARLVQGFAVGRRIWQRDRVHGRAQRSAARLLRELAVREPGSCRDHGRGVRLGPNGVAAAAETGKLGLAHSVRLRPARRSGRLLHSLASGRNARVSGNTSREAGERARRLVLESMAESVAGCGHRRAIHRRRVRPAALHAVVHGQAVHLPATASFAVVVLNGRITVYLLAVDGRALRQAGTHPHHARHVDFYGHRDLSDVCVASVASDRLIAGVAASGRRHSKGGIPRTNASAHVRNFPDARALDRPFGLVTRSASRCSADSRRRSSRRSSTSPATSSRRATMCCSRPCCRACRWRLSRGACILRGARRKFPRRRTSFEIKRRLRPPFCISGSAPIARTVRSACLMLCCIH